MKTLVSRSTAGLSTTVLMAAWFLSIAVSAAYAAAGVGAPTSYVVAGSRGSGRIIEIGSATGSNTALLAAFGVALVGALALVVYLAVAGRALARREVATATVLGAGTPSEAHKDEERRAA